MTARWQQILGYLREAFWTRPALLVVLGIALAEAAIRLDASGKLPEAVKDLVYGGGTEGARGLLSALASSSISVAGTIFSITIAALSLASGQMGPRLLRNFTKDAGNQVALGIFLATFAYALVTLRTVRGDDDGGFVPHLAVTLGLALGFLCVAVLVWFVHHAASGINVDVVVDDVYRELSRTLDRHRRLEERPAAPPASLWVDATVIRLENEGFVQHLDAEGLADQVAEAGGFLKLLLRPGQRLYPGAPVALAQPAFPDAEKVLERHLAFGSRQLPSQDIEFSARQLAEVAIRALSPGINDPYTAIAVLDRFGSALCRLAGYHLPSGVVQRQGRPVLVWPATDYTGLLDAVLHPVRQNAASIAPVLIRLLEMLTTVVLVERAPERLAALRTHAELAHEAGLEKCSDHAGCQAIEDRMVQFNKAAANGRPA